MVAAVFLLSSCSSDNKQSSQLDGSNFLNTSAEIMEGNFVYRLATEKEVYQEGGPVSLFAELEYIGDQEEITIYHAASPFYFPMIEKTRNYTIDFPINEPLIATILKKGQPLRKTYSGGSGGYGSEDKKEYVDFMKKIMNKQFPIGHYVVNGTADFFIKTNESSQKAYNLNAQISFKVESKK